MLLWAQVGFAMVLLSAAIKGVPGDTLEAARIDGANERQIFFRVVVPQIKGTIITVFITVTDRRDEDLRHRLRDDQRQLQHQRARQRVLQPAVHQLQQRRGGGDRRDADDRGHPGHDLPGAALPGRGGQPHEPTPRRRSPRRPEPQEAASARRPASTPAPAKAGWFDQASSLAHHLPAVDGPDRSASCITSFRPLDDAKTTGWWTVFLDPSTSATSRSTTTSEAIDGHGHGRRASSTASRSRCRRPSSRS